MTEAIFEKLNGGGVLDAGDLTADEKKRLYRLMTDHEASEAFAYTRFFRDGFAGWELDGILKLKVDYLQRLHCEEKIEIEYRCVETIQTSDGETYRYRAFYPMPDGGESSIDLNTPGDYWRMLGELRRRTDFAQWMQQYGMMSEVTVRKRFSTDDWREFERVGVRSIIREFIEKETKAA